MAERLILDEGGVKVTSTALVVGGKAHPIRGVTSVRTQVTWPHRLGWCAGLTAGVALMLLAGTAGKILGIALAGSCAMVLTRQRPVHSVILSGAGGHVDALSHTDRTHVAGVVAALNQALLEQG